MSIFEIIVFLCNVIDNVVNDVVEKEAWNGETFWDSTPCWLFGTWNPDGADRVLRRAQGLLFKRMDQNETPLFGWIQFDTFVDSVLEGNDFDAAYNAAKKEQPQYRVEIIGGNGTEKDPYIFA